VDVGVPSGTSQDDRVLPKAPLPLSAPIGLGDRLAHQRLDKVDLEVVWETSVREAAVVSGIVVHPYDQLATEWPLGSRGATARGAGR
jgi:hypothetical protein